MYQASDLFNHVSNNAEKRLFRSEIKAALRIHRPGKSFNVKGFDLLVLFKDIELVGHLSMRETITQPYIFWNILVPGLYKEWKLREREGEAMKIRFDTGWSSFGGRLGTGVIGTIFEQTIVLPEHKVLLLGFPSHDKGPRGTVYWLAIGAIMHEE